MTRMTPITAIRIPNPHGARGNLAVADRDRVPGMGATSTRRRRRGRQPEREVIVTGSERAVELVRAYAAQQTRIRLANARTGGLPKLGREDRKRFL